MKKAIFTFIISCFGLHLIYSQEVDSIKLFLQKIEESFDYKTGKIELAEGNGSLTVPEGFRYLGKDQSIYVLTDLWGNPEDTTILGMLVPMNHSVLEADGWAFIISYEDLGYVKDDDASDIDYNELLEEMQKEVKEANVERVKQGYESVRLVGWASPPHYDTSLNTLHWAKELAFGEEEPHTLNYNLRLLGRKGIYNLNAVASMTNLSEVQINLNKIIRCVSYNDGYTYADFDSKTDNIAAWTIGGLVAGKLLAKTGFFVMLAKFWKVIILGLAAFFGGFAKFFKKDKPTDEQPASEEIVENKGETDEENS